MSIVDFSQTAPIVGAYTMEGMKRNQIETSGVAKLWLRVTVGSYWQLDRTARKKMVRTTFGVVFRTRLSTR